MVLQPAAPSSYFHCQSERVLGAWWWLYVQGTRSLCENIKPVSRHQDWSSLLSTSSKSPVHFRLWFLNIGCCDDIAITLKHLYCKFLFWHKLLIEQNLHISAKLFAVLLIAALSNIFINSMSHFRDTGCRPSGRGYSAWWAWPWPVPSPITTFRTSTSSSRREGGCRSLEHSMEPSQSLVSCGALAPNS